MEELLCRWKNYNDYPKILQRFLEEQHINCRNWKSEAITNALEKAIVYEFENDPNIEPQNYLSTLLFEKSVLEGAADRVDMTMFISDIPIFLTTWLEECKHRSYQDSKWFGITNIVLGFIMKTCQFYSMGKTSLRGPYKIMFDMIIEEKLNTTHTIAVAGYLNDCLNKRSIKLAQPMSIVLHPYAIKIAQIITTCGDHIGQLTLSSLLFQLFVRMYSQKKRSSVAEEVFAGPNFQESVRNIVRRRVFSCVEGNQDCREFLNAMNEVYGKVVSLSCGQAYICSSIVYTQESNQGQLWVDFNTDTQRITFTLPRSLPCREDTVSSTTCMDKETIPVSVDFSTITALYLSLESNHAELSINLNAFPKLLELHESIVDKLKGQKNWELLFILLKTSQIKMLYSTILMDFKEKYHGPSMKSIEGWIYSKSDGNDGMNEGLISQCTATPNQKIPFNSEFSMSNEDRGLCPSIKKASLWHLSLPLLQIMSVTRNPSDGESINSISTTGSNLKELPNILNQHLPINLRENLRDKLSLKSSIVNRLEVIMSDDRETHMSGGEDDSAEEQNSELESVSDQSNVIAETPKKEDVVAAVVKRRIVSRRKTEDTWSNENLGSECDRSGAERFVKQTKQIERKNSTTPLPDNTNNSETMDQFDIFAQKKSPERPTNGKPRIRNRQFLLPSNPLPRQNSTTEDRETLHQEDAFDIFAQKMSFGRPANYKRRIRNKHLVHPSNPLPKQNFTSDDKEIPELRNVLNQPVPDESNKLTAETPIKEAVVATKVARRISSRRNTLAASLQENLELECEASDTECLAKQTKQIERKKSTPPLPDTTNSPETMRALLNIGTSPVKEAMQSKTKPKLVIKKSPGRPCNRRTKITTAEDKAGPQADERAVENVADVIAKKRTQKSAQSKTPKPEMHRKTTPDPYDPYQKEEYTAFEEEVDQRPKSFTGKRFFPEGLKNGIPQGYGPKRSTTPAKKQDVKKKATESSTKTRLAGKRTNGKRRELYMPSKEQTLCVSPDNSFSSGEFNPCHNLLIKRASMERGNKQAALNTIKRAKKTKPSESQHNSDNESDFSPSTSHHFINQDCSANMSQPGLMKEKRKSTRIRPKIDYRELNDSTSSAKMGDTSEHASQGVPDKTSITDDNILMPPPGGKGVQKIRGKRLDGNTKLPVSSSCQPSRAEDQNSSLEKTFNFRDTVTFNVNMSPDETNKISYDSPERMRKPSALPAFKSRESLCAAHSGSPPQLLPQDSVPKECVSAELPMKAAIKKTKKPKKNLIPKGGKVFRSSDDEAFSFPLDIEITDPKKAKVDLISNDLSCGLNEIRRSPSPDESPTRDPAVVAEEADRSCTSSPILENRTKYVSSGILNEVRKSTPPSEYPLSDPAEMAEETDRSHSSSLIIKNRTNCVSRDSSQHSSLTSDKAISEQQQSLTQRSRISTPSLESDGDITFGSVSPIQQASTIEQKNQVNNQAGREASVANETYLEDATPTASGSSQNSFREEAAEAEYVNMTRCRRSNGDNGASKKKTIMQKGAYIDGRLGYTAPKPQKSQPPKKRNTPLLLPCRPKDKKKMNLKFRVRSHNSNNKFGAVVKILQRMSFKRTKIGAFIKWLKSENDVAELVLLFINKICSSKERGQIMNGLDECRRYVMRRSGRILESDDSLGEESDDSS